MTNSIVSANTVSGSHGGGGIYNFTRAIMYNTSRISHINVMGCTVSGNTAGSGGGGIFNGSTDNNGTIRMMDCIVYNNMGSEVDNDTMTAANAAVVYSDIEGGYAGIGNIDANPLFVRNPNTSATPPDYGDLHLKQGSPCIGKGIAVDSATTDKDGKTRSNPPSIGAYEYVALWAAVALAAGPDGKTRILWDNTNRTATVWTLNADGSVASYGSTYGPISSWTARTISVGADNATRILWTNTNGAMTVWTVPADSSTPFYGPVYGPFAGWTASSIATDTANATHILWDNINGSMTLWTLPATGSPTYGSIFGPYAGFSAVGLSQGVSNYSHVLWDNTSGAMTPWTLNPSSQFVGTFPTYGPY